MLPAFKDRTVCTMLRRGLKPAVSLTSVSVHLTQRYRVLVLADMNCKVSAAVLIMVSAH